VGRLENRIALITAAGSGMGRAGAVRFAEEGAHVYVTDLRQDAAEETAKTIADAGGRATARQLDVTDLSAIKSVIDEIGDAHGVLHVLYNHAGTPGAAGLHASLEDFDITVDVNMRSSYYATSYAVDLLKQANGKGSIIYTSSVSGVAGSPFSPLYSMVKHGIVGLVRATALALAPEGIRCNAICPASVATPMLRGFLDRNNEGLTDEQMAEFVKRTVPLGRAAQPEEIANVALFLACDESSFITGVPLPVDGGFTAR
jgi:NAD(P)-dependent dehydrogenase (short-subunit alcohol dehydrogenase family)